MRLGWTGDLPGWLNDVFERRFDHAAAVGSTARRPESRPVKRAGGGTADEVGGAHIPSGAITGHFAKTPEQPWAWRVQRETLAGPASFWCGCSCGWIETGWPNYEIAKASMTGHLRKAHDRSPSKPSAVPLEAMSPLKGTES